MQSFCRTCLREMFDNTSVPLRLENFYKHQLMFSVPEMDLRALPDAKLCKDCATTLRVIYKFRIKCQETEIEVNKKHFNVIVRPMVNQKISLNNKNYAVCRTCLAVVKNSHFSFFTERQYYKRKLMFCVPEMDLQSVPDVTLCDGCRMVLDTLYKFKMKCLDVEENMKEFQQLHDIVDIRDLFVLYNAFVKTEISNEEDLTIKQEEVDLAVTGLANTHTDEKPFKCLHCEYSTVRKSCLKVHIRTHAHKQPFQSLQCEYSSSRKACTTGDLVPYSGSSGSEHDADASPTLATSTAIKARRTFEAGRAVQNIPCMPHCQHRCRHHFTVTQRRDINKFYWDLGSYDRQHNWLLTCIEHSPISHRKQNASISRRQHTWKYFMNRNAERVEVCQQFLLSTLNVSQKTIRYVRCSAAKRSAKPDERRRWKRNKTPLKVKRAIHHFIKQFPAVPSHYRHNTSTRKYLPGELCNASYLYRLFVQEQGTKHDKILPSLQVFREIFRRDFDLGFHQPKKDECCMCERRKRNTFRETDDSKAVFAAHLLMKDQIKELFLADQQRRLSDTSYICASFDLQKVLPTPYGDNLLLHCSRKYSFYNETVYESDTKHGTCFIWGEADGKRGCNEICTIMFKYLEDVDRKGVNKHVLLYCDSCAGQNHNRAMLVMLHTFLQGFARSVKTVKIVFLLHGHTYAPVNSVHATIDRFLCKRIVWAPSEWDSILRSVNVNPGPLTVVRMRHSDFRNWKQIGEDCLPADVKTSDGKLFQMRFVRQALFRKGNATFQVNYTYDASSGVDVPMPTNFDCTIHCKTILTTALYPGPLPLAVLKKRNLDWLCQQNVIPQRYRQEYLALHSDTSVPDALAETDAEDSQSDVETSTP